MTDERDFPDEVVHRINTCIQKQDPSLKVVGFSYELTYKDRVSNSHCCPKDGVMNWGGRAKFLNGKPKPTGYPGWYGRVWVRYNKKARRSTGFGNVSRFHTGTGGYGSYSGPWRHILSVMYLVKNSDNVIQTDMVMPEMFSWDCKVFADDWPVLNEEHRMNEAQNILSGGGQSSQMLHTWTDPIIEEQDKKVIQAWDDYKKTTRKND